MKKTILLGMVLIFLLLSGTIIYSYGKNISPKKELTPVTVQFYWLHTVEFAGFYMAKKQGYYEDVGLDVQFNAVDFDKKPVQQVADKLAEFGVTGEDEILESKKIGLPIKAIGAIFQQPPITFISLAEKNISKPVNLKGKRIAIECGITTEFFERGFIRQAGIKASEYTDICSDYEVSQLINDTVDVMAGYIENEPVLLEMKGYAVNNILFSDYGFFMYPNLIFTTDEMIQSNPDIVRKFLDATIKGYEYAIEHSEEAANETFKYDNTLDFRHQKLSMEKQIPLIYSGQHPIGWIDENLWNRGLEAMNQIGLMNETIVYSDAVDTQFLENKYSER